MGLSRLVWKASAVVLMGVAALLTAPKAEANATLAPCTYCNSMCPADLTQFCRTKCNNNGGTCSTDDCEGVSGTWYDYTVTCPADA